MDAPLATHPKFGKLVMSTPPIAPVVAYGFAAVGVICVLGATAAMLLIFPEDARLGMTIAASAAVIAVVMGYGAIKLFRNGPSAHAFYERGAIRTGRHGREIAYDDVERFRVVTDPSGFRFDLIEAGNSAVMGVGGSSQSDTGGRPLTEMFVALRDAIAKTVARAYVEKLNRGEKIPLSGKVMLARDGIHTGGEVVPAHEVAIGTIVPAVGVIPLERNGKCITRLGSSEWNVWALLYIIERMKPKQAPVRS